MQNESVIKLFNGLPERFQREVIHFIEFLALKAGLDKGEANPQGEKKSLFGHAKERIVVSPDFDDPLEDFSAYM